MNLNISNKIKAFNLLEISISIGIIGIILSGVTSILFALNKNKTKKINNEKFIYIKTAMENYLIQNGRLPNASYDLDGLESLYSTNGFLPYKTLGLTKEYLYDANKKPIRYVVNAYFTKTTIPLIRPLTCPPQFFETCFQRIYDYDNEGEIELYDKIAHENHDIEIYENNVSVIDSNDYFYILPPIKKFKTIQELNKWILSSKNKEEKYKTKNTIAWLIIISKNDHSNTRIFHKNKGNTIYYQTRFDMCSQTDFHCTPEPIYTD